MKHLLVLRFSSMGDVAMMIPSLRCLIKSYPDLKITIVSKKRFKPFFKEFENCNFFEVDFKNKYNGISGLLDLFKELKKLKPTHIADLHSVLRTHFLRMLFRLSFYRVKKLEKLRKEKKKLFRAKNKVLKPLVPTQYRYAEVFCKLGFNIDLTNHQFPLPKGLSNQSQQFIDSLDSRKKLIGIAPFASYVGKIYPLDLMQKVVAFLQQDNNIFLFGHGDYETEKLKVWEKAFPNVLGCYNLNSLDLELEIISNLDVMISMDSANGHIASLFGIDVITIWGATHPNSGYGPLNQPKENSIVPDLNKFPDLPVTIYGSNCPADYVEAINTIKCERILERLNKII